MKLFIVVQVVTSYMKDQRMQIWWSVRNVEKDDILLVPTCAAKGVEVLPHHSATATSISMPRDC